MLHENPKTFHGTNLFCRSLADMTPQRWSSSRTRLSTPFPRTGSTARRVPSAPWGRISTSSSHPFFTRLLALPRVPLRYGNQYRVFTFSLLQVCIGQDWRLDTFCRNMRFLWMSHQWTICCLDNFSGNVVDLGKICPKMCFLKKICVPKW